MIIRKNVNLGINCSPQEKKDFIKLLKDYKDVFSWTYNDLKTFDTIIIQHVILMKPHPKPFQ
jgi:hypothetical protein